MKKFVSILCVMVIAAACAVPAFAASEADVMSELKSGVTLGGKTYTLPAQFANGAQKYLDTHELSDDEASTIISQIADAKNTIESDGAEDVLSVSKETRQAVLSNAKAAAEVVGLKVSVGADKSSVMVTDADGNVVFQGDHPIKRTGAGVNASTAVAVASIIVLMLGAATVTGVKAKLYQK